MKIPSATPTHSNPITQKIKKPFVNPPYEKLLRGVALYTNLEDVGDLYHHLVTAQIAFFIDQSYTDD